MDKNASWRVTRQYAKTAAEWTAAESDRRKALRAERKPLVADAARARSAARAAHSSARADDPKGTNRATHRAARELKRAERDHGRAKRRVPSTLPVFAAKTAAGLGVAGYLGFPLVPVEVWGRVLVWGCVALVAAVVVGATWWAIAKAFRKAPAFTPSAEEKALLARLAPEFWREHAEARGLEGTLTARPALGESGITVSVRLDGKWTAGKLRSAEENVRALLGCRTGLRIEIKAGDKGGWAALTLRTRSAADGDDLLWTPERSNFGVDTVTGEQVEIPLGERLLIAGMSGAGKSVASRPLLFSASEGEANALAIIDLKLVEGRLWDHRARVASYPDEVFELTDELVAEMRERLALLPKGQDTWTPTVDRPRITVVVDEGAEVVTAAKGALGGLETLARMGRAACIDLWWMTQKPTIGDGIPKQIAPQLSTRICLAVSTPTEARTVLGEDAQAKGWTAEELPMPGVAFVRGGRRKPHHIRVRYMDKAVIMGLAPRKAWSWGGLRKTAPLPAPPAYAPTVHLPQEQPVARPSWFEPVERPALRLVKDDDFHLAPPAAPVPAAVVPLAAVPPVRTAAPAVAPAPAAEGADAKVLDALRVLRPPVRQKDIVEASGLPKGTVSKVVKRLVDTGVLVREADGTVAIKGAGEVSA